MVKRKNLFGVSTFTRRKLFSKTEQPAPRKKLFSKGEGEPVEYNEGGVILRQVVCRDCGHIMETSESTSHILCPNCGGSRFDIRIKPYSEPQTPETVPGDNSEEEKTFSRKNIFKESEYLTKLKEFSGKTLSQEEYEKTFSEAEREGLEEKKFSSSDENGISISESAYLTEKTFSKLIIQVTKILDLDKDIVSGDLKKEDVIEKLEESHALPEKGILVLKKAHDLPIESHYSKGCEEEVKENWLEDSGILPDLALEYANDSFGVKQFMDILNSRYPDAPENIIDLLIEAGAIRMDGSQVTINK